MQDRVPRYPGRVTLTPVAGQANTYDLVRADQPTQTGTPLNAANLFSAETAAKYPSGTETVDGALGMLGRGVIYEKKTISHSITIGEMPLGYEFEVDGFWFRKVIANYANTGLAGIYSLSGLANKTVQGGTNGGYENCELDSYYSSEYYSSLPIFIRSNMQTVSIQVIDDDSTTSGPLKSIQRKMFAPAAIELYENANYYSASTKEGTFIDGLLKLTNVKSFTRTPYNVDSFFGVDDSGIVITNRSRTASLITPPLLLLKKELSITLPDTHDIRMMDLLGKLISIPAAQIVDGVKIEIGSYVGTGTYGANNPNSLTFEFVPKIVSMYRGSHSDDAVWCMDYTTPTEYTKSFGFRHPTGNAGRNYGKKSMDGRTFYWYSDDSKNYAVQQQCNRLGETYYYFAIG